MYPRVPLVVSTVNDRVTFGIGAQSLRFRVVRDLFSLGELAFSARRAAAALGRVGGSYATCERLARFLYPRPRGRNETRRAWFRRGKVA
jgi:hypothetical protein